MQFGGTDGANDGFAVLRNRRLAEQRLMNANRRVLGGFDLEREFLCLLGKFNRFGGNARRQAEQLGFGFSFERRRVCECALDLRMLAFVAR